MQYVCGQNSLLICSKTQPSVLYGIYFSIELFLGKPLLPLQWRTCGRLLFVLKILKGILPTIPLGKYWVGQLYYWWALRKDSKWHLQKPVFWSETVLFSEDEGNNCFYLIILIVSLILFLRIAFALRKLSTWIVNKNIPFLRNTNQWQVMSHWLKSHREELYP